nr:hypothetical protein [Azospirillum brasilense]
MQSHHLILFRDWLGKTEWTSFEKLAQTVQSEESFRDDKGKVAFLFAKLPFSCTNQSQLALMVPYSSATHATVIFGPPDFSVTTDPSLISFSIAPPLFD